MIILFILSLIPLYIIGIFDHPSVDDYYYGVETARTWQDTGSLSAVIEKAAEMTVDTYNEWQGNFAAIFLMRLQPAIFGEQYYVIAPIILITCFAAAMLAFFTALLTKWFKADRGVAITVALAITFIAMQFCYKPSDSFYWYNGAIYYTFFFSLMLFLFTMVTLMIHGQHKQTRIIALILALPTGILIGGGNYVTALFTVIVLCLITLYYFVRKNRIGISLLTVTLVTLAGLIFSVIAPGNAIRQASVGGSTGVVKALLYSFAYGGYNIASATTATVIILWIFLLPVFYRIASGMNFSFKLPLLFLVFTFGVFCSQGTPVFYAQGLKMPYRIMNIIYFCYYIFMTLNLIYLMGYLHRRFEGSAFDKIMTGVYDAPKKAGIFALACVICLAVSCVGVIKVEQDDDGNAAFSNMPMSVSAAFSLVSGEAAEYDRELNERVKLLSGDENIVTVPALTVTPETIFHTDITADCTDWKNVHLALFYHKNIIMLEE